MINDLPGSLKDVDSSLFADDSCIFKSGRNIKFITNLIQDNLDRISNWCDKWWFKISLDKTVAVIFTHHKITSINLSINNNSAKIDNKAIF